MWVEQTSNNGAELLSDYRSKVDRLFLRMNHRELPIVASIIRYSQPRPLLWVVKATNRLCDGWIYLPIMLALSFLREWRLLLAASIGVVVCFVFYYCTKPQLARVRPCDFAAGLQSLSRCLDEYSFPSGHCMTWSVVSVLLCWQHHGAIPVLIATILLLYWARIAAAHHYPTDLLAGTGIGFFVGMSLGFLLL